MRYEYFTANIHWRIVENAYEQGCLYRMLPDSLFGSWPDYVGDYASCLAAERAADNIELDEYPLERVALEPIPLVREHAA